MKKNTDFKFRKEVLMTKKVILLVLITIVAVSSLFAMNNVVFVTGSPYAKQINVNNFKNVGSNYGFGFKAGYRYFDSVFLWGFDVAYQNYKYNGAETSVHLGDLQILAKIGGKIAVSDKVDLNGDIGCGIEIGFSRKAVNYLFAVAGDASMSFYVTPKVAVVGGLDISVTWPKTSKTVYKSAEWNIVPVLGAEIDF
jgi:hypothetical protein